MDYIRDTYKSSANEIISSFSIHCSHLHLEKNKIMMKVGDKGDRFYVILKGTLAILIPKTEKIVMTEDEYYIYLCKLKLYCEDELLNRVTINVNNNAKFSFKKEKLDFYFSTLYPKIRSPGKKLSTLSASGSNPKYLKRLLSNIKTTTHSCDLAAIKKYSNMPQFENLNDYINELKPVVSELNIDNPKAKEM